MLEENRELRVVAIPDSTSGDLRMRVGGERFWNALDLIAPDHRGNGHKPAAAEASAGADPARAVPAANDHAPSANGNGHGEHGGPPALHDGVRVDRTRPAKAAIVGHIPVTWRTADELPQDSLVLERLQQCLDLILRSQVRHGSPEVWLSPFLKGPMSQHFSGLVHPERRALVNELRHRGVIRIEERANQYADHPYSVIVLDEAHPMVVAAHDRARKREEVQ